MASTKVSEPVSVQAAEKTGKANVVAVTGWLVPGAGYFLVRRWVRGTLVFVCIIAMFVLGLAMQGQLYGPNARDLLDLLGWIGDLSSGLLYWISRAVGWGAGNQFTVMGDYGTKFLVAAGLLNLLTASDARDIALGRKS